MIIGISGKLGSGKDTVGQIISYLILNELYKDEDSHLGDQIKAPFSLDKDYGSFTGHTKGFVIRKFADKLKDIVCLLIGCTREQLEDREFKEKPLGEEWVQHFDANYDLTTKEGAQFSEPLTPRKLMQLLGTEAGRQIIHENIWVNALFADYINNFIPCEHWQKDRENIHCLCGGINAMGENKGTTFCEKETTEPNWIITDTRFPNEAKAIKDRGGLLIRVERFTDCSNCGENCNCFNKPVIKEHESETALDNYQEWDCIIDNDGTIEDLIEEVRLFLKGNNII